ncbi:dual specificity protein phosphatase [Trypanosoma conorhini]|uniref:protein-tyrosine-phosphatase n=1 Tax=Trypanosoma conorhini TaxID=83891 RepID=A0A422PHQ6_9TRYP|nr:dual specificity protein phosphatase [Trypanosoma conorhini]RNF17255.1 dual specificity protein phosphatase [Trypanosoma conorhini]
MSGDGDGTDGDGGETVVPPGENRRQPPRPEPQRARPRGLENGGRDAVEEAGAATMTVVATNSNRSQAAGAQSQAGNPAKAGTAAGGGGGDSAPAGAGGFFVGTTTHVSLAGAGVAGARIPSFGLSTSQMKAVLDVVRRRKRGEQRQVAAPGVQPHPITPPTTAATLNETPTITPALSQSEHGRSTTSSLNEIPLLSGPPCTGASTPISVSSGRTEPHSCHEKEEERDFFIHSFAPRLQTGFSASRTPPGDEAKSRTQAETQHQAGAEVERQEDDEDAEQQQRPQPLQVDEVWFDNDENVSRVHHRWAELSAGLRIRVPASPWCPAAGEPIPTCKQHNSDFDFSASSSFGSSYSRSLLQAYNQHTFVRAASCLSTNTPCVSPCVSGVAGGDADAPLGTSKVPASATPMRSNGGGGCGGSAVPSCQQYNFLCGVQRRGTAAPLQTPQEGTADQISSSNGHQNGVIAPPPLAREDVDHAASFDAAMVLPGLYLGSHSDAMKLPALAAHGISLVLSVAEECVLEDSVVNNEYNIRFVKFPLRDHSDENIASYFGPLTKMIHKQLHRRECALWKAKNATPETRENGEVGAATDASSVACVPGGVLVHCRMGVSRSAAVVLAYLMIYGDTLVVDEGCYSQQQQMEESPTIAFTPLSETSPFLPANDDETAKEGRRCRVCCCCRARQNRMVGDYCECCEAAPRVVKSYREAFAFLKRRKRDINPNIGFVLALRELEGREER